MSDKRPPGVDAEVDVAPGTFFHGAVRVRAPSKIGPDCLVQYGAYITTNVRLGRRVFVGPHAVFTNDRHPKVGGTPNEKETVVEDDAVVGANATVLAGVRIGRGAVVGAGAVVTRDVPPGETWAGCPARPLAKPGGAPEGVAGSVSGDGKPLSAQAGAPPVIERGARVSASAWVGWGCIVWKGAEVGPDTRLEYQVLVPPDVSIGSGVFVASHVVFCNDKHPRAHRQRERRPTVVENGASIGANATVLPGVRIGRNAVVGAGSVVTKDIPDGETWAGNPARRLK